MVPFMLKKNFKFSWKNRMDAETLPCLFQPTFWSRIWCICWRKEQKGKNPLGEMYLRQFFPSGGSDQHWKTSGCSSDKFLCIERERSVYLLFWLKKKWTFGQCKTLLEMKIAKAARSTHCKLAMPKMEKKNGILIFLSCLQIIINFAIFFPCVYLVNWKYSIFFFL